MTRGPESIPLAELPPPDQPTGRWKRRARWVTRLARLGVLGAIALLLLAWQVPLDPTGAPSRPRWELIASLTDALRFQVGLALGLAAFWLVAARSWRFAVVACLACASAVVPALGWPPSDRLAAPGSASLRVMSINLEMDVADEALVIEALRTTDPDVVVLQEYTPAWARRLKGRFSDSLPHRVERPRDDAFGIAAFSRQPWLRVDELTLGGSLAPQLRLELELASTRVVLYALHLLPPRTSLYTAHRAQCADLLERLARESKYVMAAGDFNLVDHTAVGREIHRLGFLDAHGVAGTGRGATWPVNGPLRFVPGIRIDHIYLGRGITSTAAWVGGNTGSDHLPIACDVTLARE